MAKFTDTFSTIFGGNSYLVKKAVVSVLEAPDRDDRYYLNLRVFYKEGDDLKPTRKGVILRPEEFIELLPSLERRTDWKITNETEDRCVEFQMTERPFIFSLKVTKKGHETTISFSDYELSTLLRNRDNILRLID